MRKKTALYFSVIVSGLLIIPILLLPAFGPIDDHRVLNFQDYTFTEIIHNHFTGLIASKRFVPFGLIDQYLLSRISFTPDFFYLMLFLLATSGLVSLYLITNKIISQKTACIFIPFMLLSIAFTDNFYRLAPAEKYLFLFIPLFLLLFYKFLENEKRKYYALLIVIANLAIYQKEIIFVIFGIFASIYILEIYLGRKKNNNSHSNRGILFLNAVLILSCIGFTLTYYLAIFSKGNSGVGFGDFYNLKIIDRINSGLKIYESYLFTVPIVSLYIPLIFIIRILIDKRLKTYFIQNKKEYLIPFYDSLLISSWIYTVFVCLTGQGSFGRYLLPAVLFSFFPLIEYFYAYYRIIRNKYLRIIPFLIIFYSLLNSSIRGIEWGLWFKIDEYSFQNTLSYINKESQNKGSIKIYLADKDPFGNAEIFQAYGWFLQKQCNISRDRFDLYSIQIPKRDLSKDWWTHDPKASSYEFSNYAAIQSLEFRKPQKGDIIIVSANNLRKDTTVNAMSDLNIVLRKMNSQAQKFIYFPNPISLSVFRGKKPLLRKYTLYNDIYIVSE